MEAVTFSRRVKDELTRHCIQNDLNGTNGRLCLLSCLFSAARLRSGIISLSTSHYDFAGLLQKHFDQIYGVSVELQTGRELYNLTVTGRNIYRDVTDDLRKLFGYDPVHNSLFTERNLTAGQLQTALRGVFLACGSLGDPRSSYHLEFSLRRLPAAVWLIRQLKNISVSGHLLRKQGYSVVYIKEGQQIADMLQYCGAHESLLDFEVLRVEKDMRNSVNRVVNCDSANTQRIANASARQLELLRYLDENDAFGILPEDIAQAARARIENPDLSLRELGEIMNPPLGKSGMNHRLKRLEKIASELMEKNQK
jgi:DNA-binding protein WhiA